MVLAILFLVGMTVRSCERAKAFEARVEAANAVADTFKAKYDSATATFEDRLRQAFDQRALTEELKVENRELADRLEDLNARLISVNRSVVGLADRFTGSADATGEGGLFSFRIDEVHQHGRSSLGIAGPVSLQTDGEAAGEASYDLSVTGRLFLTSSLARLPNDEIRVDLASDFPGISVEDVSGTYSPEDLGLEGHNWLITGAVGLGAFLLGVF